MAEKNCVGQPRTSARLDAKNYNDITPQPKNNNNNDLLENNYTDIANTTDNDKNGSNDEDNMEQWDFKGLYSAEEILSDNPPQCDTDDCGNIACSKWTQTFLPKNEWKTCAACLDNEGWPTEDDEGLPATPLSNIHSDAILANCTNDQFQTAESMIEAGLLVEDVDNDEDNDVDYRNDEVNEECDDEGEDYDGENASLQKKRKRRGGKRKGSTSNKKQPSSAKKNGKEKEKKK